MPDANFDKATLAWTLPWDADWVSSVCFLADRRVAAGNNLGQILVWELPDKPGTAAPNPLRQLKAHTNGITRLLAAPDGRTLISASLDHTIRFWDAQATGTGQETVALNARTREDLIARRSSKVPPALEAKVAMQKPVCTLEGHRDWIVGLTLSNDGKLLVSGDDSGNVVVWDCALGKELRRWQVKGWVYALALSPDNQQLFLSERRPLVFDSGRLDSVKLWDANTLAMQRDLSATFKGMFLSAAAYSPDGKLLAVGRGGEIDGTNGKVFLVDPATGQKKSELAPGHLNGLTDLCFHPDGKHLASCGRDTLVRIWSTADGKLVKELGKSRGGQFKDWLHAVSFSRDGRWLAAADMAGAVQVWALGE